MINLEYNGKSFNQREEDSYINLGQLCATHDKQFHHWKSNQSSTAYLEALSASVGIPCDLLLCTITNGSNDIRGTWGHPLVALEVARWISPEFGVWCNMHIKTLMETGTTSLEVVKPNTEIVQPDLSELMVMMQTVIKQNQEQKENMQNQKLSLTRLEQQNLLLLADKSEKEVMGELVSSKFEGISDLLKGVLGEIARKYGEDINKMYKIKNYYTLKEIALRFFPEDKVTDIVNKSRCNINGLYKSMTKLLLPQEKGNYQYDKTTVIFALWRLHHCAKELGLNVEFIDLENKEYIDSLEDLFGE